MIRFCTKSRKYSIVAPGLPLLAPATLPLVPLTGGKNMPGVDSAALTAAAAAAAVVVSVCKLWESHSRATGVAAIAGVVVVLVIVPDDCCCCCC